MSFEAALKVADAILHEGYVLYPYRASAAKNRFRWQFGVVAPRDYSEATELDDWQIQTECLLEPLEARELRVRLRFLCLESRRVERIAGSGFESVERFTVDGKEHFAWDEGVEHEVDGVFGLADLVEGERSLAIAVEREINHEAIEDARGNTMGRYVRERLPLEARLTARAEAAVGPSPLLKLRLRVENLTEWSSSDNRDEALRSSLIGAHTLLHAPSGEFLSMTEPPEWARGQVQACTNLHAWPVLAGEEGTRDLVLSSPIILYDYPQIAPESPGEFFDATEIDELLALRTMTLTADEKEEARLTDPRSAALIDQTDALPPELMDRLHGAIRYLREVESPKAHEEVEEAAAPDEDDSILVDGAKIRPGDVVQIKAGLRATDAQDLFLAGRCAVVEKVMRDVDDRVYAAVSLADDPATDLHRWHGRYLYFDPSELELPGGGR